MRIVFFGASELGYACCERLLERGEEVVAIFTIPRQFNISYSPGVPVENVLFADFHALGQKFDIPVVEVTGKMHALTSRVAACEPDLILAIGWYYLVPRSIRDTASRGCVGIHGSLLPKYRGGAPLVWAMIHGESETGITLFHLADGVDDGDIVAQKRIPISRDDTIREVLDRARAAAIELVEEFVPAFANGTAPRTPQDHSLATYVPQRKPADGVIDWGWEPERIRNFIRAQTKPYPGAFTICGDKKVTIWSADVEYVGPVSLPPREQPTPAPSRDG